MKTYRVRVITGSGDILDELVNSDGVIVGSECYTFYAAGKRKHYPINRTIVEELDEPSDDQLEGE